MRELSQKKIQGWWNVGAWMFLANLAIGLVAMVAMFAMTGTVNRPAVVVVLVIFTVVGMVILYGWSFTGAVKRANKV